MGQKHEGVTQWRDDYTHASYTTKQDNKIMLLN